MANENNIVEVGIETKVSGEKKIAGYAGSLEKLDKIKLENLNKAQTTVSNLESKLKTAADAGERLRKALEGTGIKAGSTSGVDKQAQAAAKAELAANKLAATQQKAAQIQTNSQNAAANATTRNAAATTRAAASATSANSKLSAAQRQAQISAQNLATAQTRADQAQGRAAISANNLATASTRSAQAQARAAIAAQNIQNAQIRTQLATDNLNRRLAEQSGWNGVVRGVGKANAALGSFGQNLSNAGRSLTATVTTSIAGLGYFSLDSAKNLDSYRNKLTAFEGSVEAAESKIAKLRQLAQDSAGVTTAMALDTYSQLTAIGELNEATIDKQIKATGKLNSAFSIPDPKEYNRNLVQIFQQDFERQDIKQALGVNPLFEQLLENAFGTKDQAKLKELKNAGKLTLDKFIEGLADATNNDERLSKIGDSIGVRLTKTFERIQFAFAPLGEAIFKAIEPLIPYIVAFVEKLAAAFGALSPYAQTVAVIIGAVVAAAGPVLVLLGGIIAGASSLIAFLGTVGGALSTVGAAFVSFGGFISSFIGLIGSAGLTASFSALASVLGGTLLAGLTAAAVAFAKIIAGIAVVVAVVAAAAAVIGAAIYLIYQIWEKNIGGIQQKAFAAFNAVKNFVVATFNQIKTIFQTILPQLEKLTSNVLSAIQNFWDLHGEQIVSVVKVLWNIVKVVVTEGINIIGGIIKFTLALINKDWKTAGEAMSSIVDSAWKIVLNIVGAAVRLFIEALQGLMREIFKFLDQMYYAAIELANRFLNGLIETIRNAPALISSALDYLINNAVSDAASAAYNAGARLWEYLKNGFNGGQSENPITTPQTNEPVGVAAGLSAKIPRKSSGGGGGKKKKGGGSKQKPNYEPIDANQRAEAESALENARFNSQVELDNLQRGRDLAKFFGTEWAERLKLTSIGLAEFYRRSREQRQKDFELEVADLEARRARAELILSKMPVGGKEENRRERDKQLAEITQLTGEIGRKRAEGETERIKLYRAELDAIFDVAAANKDLYRTFLELNDETYKLSQFNLDEEFGARFEQNKQELAAAKESLKIEEAAIAAGETNRTVLAERYKLLVETLTKNAEYLEGIKSQKELQADFNENEKQLNAILDKRQTAIDNLNRSLEAAGTGDDEATAARRAEMEKYRAEIDKVIARLEFLAGSLKNPDAKKALEAFKKQRADEQNVPFAERLRSVQQPFENSLRERDRKLRENELSGGSEFEKEARRLSIIRETTAALLAQADAYVALAKQSGNPQIIADAEAQRDAIREAGLEVQSYGTKIRNTAVDAFASGLQQFFTDLVSGTKSASDALLDFVGNFINAIAQIIIQMLALAAVKMLLRAFGIDIPVSLGGATPAGGSKNGGAASRLPFAGKFAQGGAINQYNNGILIGAGGFISGKGTATSDSIPAFFPAARKFGRVSDTEFILDAETTRNIGVEKLNQLLKTKGRGTGNLFGRLANRSGNFATGGAASESVLSGIANFETPEITGGGANVDMTTLNYFGKKPIEEVIAEHALSPAGDRLFVNQYERNAGKLKARHSNK